MIYTQADLLKLIHDTRAVSIWDHAKGPVFWYAANVPGPFYLNTELLIGKAQADHLLREITAIVAGTADAQARAAQLEKLIMTAYQANPVWQRLVATLLDKAREIFAQPSSQEGDFNIISGGERRDWLFSIPFAHAIDMPHLFLFKDQSVYSAQPLPAQKAALHVSDLINNAESIFERWLPVLARERIPCAGNLCVNIRGENGIRRLREAHIKTAGLAAVDNEFFRHLRDAQLIAQATYEELAIFFASARDWAVKYLIGKPALFDAAGCDAKSFERLRVFIQTDPWKLRPQNESFFATMQQAIDRRINRAA